GSGGGGGGGASGNASGLSSEVAPDATGRGGDIRVTGNVIRIADGAQVAATTQGPGAAGAIELEAAERLTLIQEAQINASTESSARGGDVRLTAPRVEVLDGVRIGSVAAAAGAGGDISIVAPDALIVTGTNGAADPARNRGSRITAGSFFTATGDAGSIDIRAGRIELDDGARITASTSGIGAGGSVTIDASGPITLAGARGDGSGSAIKASTEVEAEEAGEVDAPRIGNAGRVSIRAPSLVLADGAEIVGNTALAGTGGEVLIDVGEHRIGHARIATESTAAGADAGAAGAVSVIVADALVLQDGGRISASTIDGRGGSVTLRSDRILIDGTGSVSAATIGAGQGGDIALAARSIDLR